LCVRLSSPAAAARNPLGDLDDLAVFLGLKPEVNPALIAAVGAVLFGLRIAAARRMEWIAC
jgi:hypothetical protein